MSIVLEAKNLRKQFGKYTAVSNVSLELGKGEVLGLLGVNGAGKTTTIQMLLGVMKPTAGSVAYFGKDLGKYRSEIMEKVSFSSTYVNLPWDLKVKEILSYSSFLYNIPKRKQRIAEVVELFKLGNLLENKVLDLSSGQETRLNLAKAFINNPEVLILDEPTASLDPDIADYIRKFLLEQQKRTNLSILITSHNMAEVDILCDRVIFLSGGEIIANDTPASLAKTIKISHLQLLIPQREQAEAFLAAKGLKGEWEDNWLCLDVEEKELAGLLQLFQQDGIEYAEINIDKPTLEDYFLAISRENASD